MNISLPSPAAQYDRQNEAETRRTLERAMAQLLGNTVSDAQITRKLVVDHGNVTGTTTRTWAANAHRQMQTLTANTVTTIAGIPLGEFFFVDVAQDGTGGWTHSFVVSGLPALRWNNNVAPVQTATASTQDSYLFYNQGPRVIGSRSWVNVSTV